MRGFGRHRWVAGVAVAVLATAGPARADWLAGDLHVHTGYSHDVLQGGLTDDNTGAEDLYTYGYTVRERFAQAHDRGLDFLAITDHNDVRSQRDPGFGADGVIAVPAYENSLRGHGQMLGARRVYDHGDASPVAVRGMVDALRADGGVFQANHPAGGSVEESLLVAPSAYAPGLQLDWTYGFAVTPDTIEVWNAASPPNEVALGYWEDWLTRGARIAATGGSDSHWQTTNALQGPGQPTTWVDARRRSTDGVVAALRAGRTSLSFAHPGLGGPLLVLDAADGSAGIGDEVALGTPLRARVLRNPVAGTVVIRANGRTLASLPLTPGGEVRFSAPVTAGWVRASLIVDADASPFAAACLLIPGESLLAHQCRNGRMLAAMTSPIYVAPASARELTLDCPRRLGARRLRRGVRVGVTAVHSGDVELRLTDRRDHTLARATGYVRRGERRDFVLRATTARQRLRLVVTHRDEHSGRTTTVRRSLVRVG